MSPCRRGLRVFAGLVGLIGTSLAGCLGGFVVPTISLTPAIRIGTDTDEVYAVRVDVVDEENCPEVKDRDCYLLHPVPLTSDGGILPQLKLDVDYGWLWNYLVQSYAGHTHHTMMVRIYRPGWRTVEIKSWQLSGRMKWKEAPDLATQEKALDDLVATWDTDFQGFSYRMEKMKGVPRPRDSTLFRCLAPGSISKSHRNTLLFAASEYDRLSILIPPTDADEPVRQRLNEKAATLRKLAKK